MSLTYNKYLNRQDHCWYDSSNIVYSKFFDIGGPTSMKIVFKGGRTYLYRDVDPNDYIQFKLAESNGEAFNKFIRKYPTVKQDDTDLTKLEAMRSRFLNMDKYVGLETAQADTTSTPINLKLNDKTGEFIIECKGVKAFEGIEGQVSIMNLLKSLHIPYTCEMDDNVKLTTLNEFENISITQ